MVLIDTSVWIDFFNGIPTAAVDQLKKRIEIEDDICISDVILTEILQGFRQDKDYARAREHLVRFPVLRLRDNASYISAAQIYRACRKQGITVRKTIDCIIAQTAIEHNVSLLHADRDFDAIATICPLKICRHT